MDFLKSLGGMGQLMKQAGQIKGELEQLKQDAKDRTIEVSKSGVSISMNGTGEVLELTVDSELLSPERKQELEDALRSSINESNERVKSDLQTDISSLAGGLF